jgi:hypothetical protein
MKPNFNAKDNPLPWLDWVLNGASHDNFFEKRVTEYSVNGLEGDWGWDTVDTLSVETPQLSRIEDKLDDVIANVGC